MTPSRRLPGLALAALVACGGGEEPASTSDTSPLAVEIEEAVRPLPGKTLGRYKLTYYHLAVEPEDAAQERTLYDRRCQPIAKTSRRFSRNLARQGSGRLEDGRVLNVAGNCECDRQVCYFVVDSSRWGVGATEGPLRPLRSVAAGAFSLGTVLYVPRLDGLVIPGAAPWELIFHDGCVLVDDRGVEGRHLDLFVGHESRVGFFQSHGIYRARVRRGGERCAYIGEAARTDSW